MTTSCSKFISEADIQRSIIRRAQAELHLAPPTILQLLLQLELLLIVKQFLLILLYLNLYYFMMEILWYVLFLINHIELTWKFGYNQLNF